jgi:hypothetical protein
LPSVGPAALGKVMFFFKKGKNFAECRACGTRQSNVFLKRKKLCRVPDLLHSTKCFFKKKEKKTLPSADPEALGKVKKNKTCFTECWAGTRQSNL